MLRVSTYLYSLLAAGVCVTCAYGQAVISTRSGLVHYFEGTVTVGGQPLEAHFGKFAAIPEGGELRTEQGRAEILLTPGVILRVGDKSAIRMLSTSLADTKVELLAGSAIMESADAAPGTSVALIFQKWTVRQPREGSYRVDSDPPRVRVQGGTLEVKAVDGDAPVSVEQGNDLPLEAVLAPEKTPVVAPDSFSDWAEGRAQSISADNAIAADIQDPVAMNGANPPMDAFTYFPLLGYPPMASTVGSYNGLSPYSTGLYGTALYQPGFYSLYLPGYAYRPLILGLPGLGLGLGLGHSGFSPIRTGTGIGSGFPYRSPVTSRPVTPPPLARPVVRAIGHR